eukprot:PhM_4_TR2070/c1_g1_i5/m.47690
MTTNTVTRESTSTTRHHNATSTSSIPHYEPCESNKNNIHSILRTQPTPITNIEDLYIVHHEMPHMKGSTLRETIIPATDRADARTPVAIRAARKAQLTPRQRRQLEREAHLLRVSGADAASCNHFVRLHAFVETALSVYVVTERLGCDLEDHCRRSAAPLPEATVCHIMRCVLRAVAYLHEHDVAHNNIAMHNIFIDDTQSSGSGAVVRVGGLSRVSRARDASERAAASRGDVCRCGVLMYNLLLLHGDDSGGGVAVDEAEALRRLSDGKSLFPTTSPSLSSRSNAAKQLVRRLLLNSNNVSSSYGEDKSPLSASDALRHHFFLHVNATESDPAAVEAVGRKSTLSDAVADATPLLSFHTPMSVSPTTTTTNGPRPSAFDDYISIAPRGPISYVDFETPTSPTHYRVMGLKKTSSNVSSTTPTGEPPRQRACSARARGGALPRDQNSHVHLELPCASSSPPRHRRASSCSDMLRKGTSTSASHSKHLMVCSLEGGNLHARRRSSSNASNFSDVKPQKNH